MMLSGVRPRSAVSRCSRRMKRRSASVSIQVEAVAQVRFVQHEDALNDHSAGRWQHAHFGGAVVDGEVVDRHWNRLAVGEHVEVLVEQLPVERVGMVVVELRSFLER